jgi:DivIVA domain-containing protein
LRIPRYFEGVTAVPIKPQEINSSKLPVGMRGYQREPVDEFLRRIAWDYGQATREHDSWAKDEKFLRERVAELEAELAAKDAQFALLQQAQYARVEQELRERTGPVMEELSRLRAALAEHEGREEMVRTLLSTAQRSARETRESTRAECEALLKAAHRRAVDIEHDAHGSLKQKAAEVERLRRLENDLKAQLRRTLESVLGGDEPQSREAPQELPVTID